MELGNMLFGNSRGEYPFPDRDLVDCDEWTGLCDLVCDSYGHAEDWMEQNEMGGVTTDVFEINPYYWGDCTCGAEENDEDEHHPDCRLLVHNFIYKPTGFCIDWYKYPFRDSFMSENLSCDEIRQIWKACITSMNQRGF